MLDDLLANNAEEITLSRIMKPHGTEKSQVGVWYQFVNDTLLLPRAYKRIQVKSESPEDPFTPGSPEEPKEYHIQFLNLLMEYLEQHKYEGILAGDAEHVHKKDLNRSQVIEEIVHELIPRIKEFAK